MSVFTVRTGQCNSTVVSVETYIQTITARAVYIRHGTVVVLIGLGKQESFSAIPLTQEITSIPALVTAQHQ